MRLQVQDKPKLLTREEFRKQVFERQNNQCLSCTKPAVDAHHIFERRLWDDGGYYLNNGVALCEACHLQAEGTMLSVETIMSVLESHYPDSYTRIFPDHLEYGDYDKWGNYIMSSLTRTKGELFHDESVQKVLKEAGVTHLYSQYVKYPRTYHLPFSASEDQHDRMLPDCKNFEGKQVVVTEKMDGENTSGYHDGHIHTRSLEGRGFGTSGRAWVKSHLTLRIHNLPLNWRVCGENVSSVHSIHYDELESFFLMFSIWNDKNECLSWAETEEWAELLDFKTVKVLYKGPWNEGLIRNLYDLKKDGERSEGYVVRLADKFNYGKFRKSVAKYVRPDHVRSHTHWSRNIIANKLKK
jgi:hypothetical protein